MNQTPQQLKNLTKQSLVTRAERRDWKISRKNERV